jgi:hypothetical protein
MSADPAADVREEADEVTARHTARWSMDLLARTAADTGALYGTVAVEQPMRTPAALAAGGELAGLPFVGRALTDAVSELLPALRNTLWDHQEIDVPVGTLFADIAPFRTDDGPDVWADHAQDAEAGPLVGTAVSSWQPSARTPGLTSPIGPATGRTQT